MCQNLENTRPTASNQRRTFVGALAAAAAVMALAFTGTAAAQEGVIRQSNNQRTQINVSGGQATFTIVGLPGDQCFGRLPNGALFFAGTLSNLRFSSWATSWSPRPGGKFAVTFRFTGIPPMVNGGQVLVKRNGTVIDADVVRVN